MMRLSATFLVIANLFPLVGVLFLGWDVFLVLLLFWSENVVIGVFGIARQIVAGDTDAPGQGLFLPVFFLVHYGGFMFGHLMVLFAMFSDVLAEAGRPVDPVAFFEAVPKGLLLVSLGAMFVSHGWSFVENFMGNTEHERLTPTQAMALPYRRMMITHVALLAGGFVLERTGQPLAGLVLLIFLKIALDLAFHKREHARLAPSAAGAESVS